MFVDQKWQTPQDLPSHLLSPLDELKSHGVDTLLQSLFGALKVAGASRHVSHAECSAGGGRGGPGRGLGREGGRSEELARGRCGVRPGEGAMPALDLTPNASAPGLGLRGPPRALGYTDRKLQCPSPA